MNSTSADAAARPGLRIGFLGVDGIGKTSLTRALGRRFDAQGVAHETVSWRRIAEGTTQVPTYPATSAKQLWVEDWRLLYGGGSVDGSLVEDRIPTDHRDFARLDVEATFPLGAEGVRASGPLASGLVELAMDYVFEAEVVRPRASRGMVVMRETFGYKPVLKSLLIGRECAAGSVPADAIDRAIERVAVAYADPFLQPDIGIFLDGDLHMALGRRSAEGRGVGVGEDYSLAGLPDSYLSLQGECQVRFRDAARLWGWHRVEVGQRTPEEICDQVVQEVLPLVPSVHNDD